MQKGLIMTTPSYTSLINIHTLYIIIYTHIHVYWYHDVWGDKRYHQSIIYTPWHSPYTLCVWLPGQLMHLWLLIDMNCVGNIG